MEPRRQSAGRLSLRQVAKGVLFVALGSAWSVPALRYYEAGSIRLETLVVLIGMAVPLLWALLGLVLLRAGPWKEWLIVVFLLLAMTVAFGLGLGMLVFEWHDLPRVAGLEGPGRGIHNLSHILIWPFWALGVVVLGAGVVLLGARVCPRSCPACGWRARVWIRSARLYSMLGPNVRHTQCLRCGMTFEQIGEVIEPVASSRSGPP